MVSAAETALKKLKKAEIAAFYCKKQGARFIFYVKPEQVEKVFAIFDKACYNVTAVKESAGKRLLSFAKLRAGLVVGAALFVALACFANTLVLKIEVSGSGSYLEPEVRKIVLDEGAGEFKPFSALNKSVATGRILALPQVTFCNIARRGSVLVVDVQVDSEHYDSASGQPLVCDRAGTVKNIVTICGTAAVSAGDAVKKGDVLIYAHTVVGEERVGCLAAGYAEIECRQTKEFFAAEESDENLKNAYSSLLLEDGQVLKRSYTVKPTSDGVIYVLEFWYLHKLSINLS